MSGRIVFLTEEESIGAALRHLLPNLFPEFREQQHWLIIPHQGKSDLEHSFPKKMKAWREPGVKFVILRDNDGADCLALKQRLVRMVPNGAPDYLIRIVCQELEGWFLGDMGAVAAAYPRASRQQSFKSLSRKDPDSLPNAADLMMRLTGTQAKVTRATLIATHMQPALNRSTSFGVFVSGISRFFSSPTENDADPSTMNPPHNH